MTDKLINDREVAELLGISCPTVWRHAAAGLLPRPLKLGGSSRWPQSEILNLVEDLKAQRTDAA